MIVVDKINKEIRNRDIIKSGGFIEVAKRLGVSRQYLYDVVSEKSVCSKKVYKKLIKLL